MLSWNNCCYLYLFGSVLSCGICAIIRISGDQSVETGSDVKLTCIVQNLNEPIIWVKLPNFTFSLPETEDSESRIFISRGRRRNTSVLHMRNVSWTDAGTYQCRQKLSNAQVSSSIRVYVTCKSVPDFELPSSPLVFKYGSDHLVANQGLDIRLFCNDSGNQAAKVVWRKQNLTETGNAQREMVFPGKYLNICSVQRRDQGLYSCEIVDDSGRTTHRDVFLVVHYAPAIAVPKPKVNQALNYSSQLQCFVDAFPTPEVAWFKEEIELSNDTRYTIALFDMENNVVSSTLTVMVTEAEDFGNYTCSAENKLGLSRANLKLLESPLPVFESVSFATSEETLTNEYEEMNPNPPMNLTGFILGMMPPLCISFYIIFHLGFRSRYAEERPEEEGGDGVDEIVWEQGLKLSVD